MKPRARGSTADGFILMEALLALALLALTLGLFATSLSFARRVAAAGATREHIGQVAVGSQALAGWLAGAMALRKTSINSSTPAQFDGRKDGLSFITLSNGDVLPGGLMTIAVSVSGSIIVFEAEPLPVGQDTAARRDNRNILVDRVVSAEFRYYGSRLTGAPPQWYNNWQGAEAMPQLVGLRVTMFMGPRTETIDLMFMLPDG